MTSSIEPLLRPRPDGSGYESADDDVPRRMRGYYSFAPDPSDTFRARHAMGNGANGVWTATRFSMPPGLSDSNPHDIFASRPIRSATGTRKRFVIRSRHVPALSPSTTMAIFTDGACTNNGAGVGKSSSTGTPQGGCAFVLNGDAGGIIAFPLETQEPSNVGNDQTNNRAELQAAIEALQFRSWSGEGWGRVVLITDSEYVAFGATLWLRRWAENGWRTSQGGGVKNADLWHELSDSMGEMANDGCEVSFWKVPRRWVAKADMAARQAANNAGPDQHAPIYGIVL
ncbi:ribonuclease H-like domain-containing protein [Phyllosticta citribraziliensis]|uniref:ribonuclease H n=1 Tax=Phyllosticta citribraziliensis TaxID=989973 RepID=A0ABR1LBL4_9PEZI